MVAIDQFLAIRRAVSRWENKATAALSGHHGLSVSDFAVLHHLAEAPGYRLRRVDLAQHLALTPSGITRLLNPLERRGINQGALGKVRSGDRRADGVHCWTIVSRTSNGSADPFKEAECP